MIPRIDIDIGQPPGQRWAPLGPHIEAVRRLMDCYVRDLGGLGTMGSSIASYAKAFISAEHREEIAAIARLVGRPEQEVLLGNLYYEAFRQLIGCSAFACDTSEGPIHARNLDWWTEDQMLARMTCVYRVRGGPVGPYEMVGWPGFIGALSGLAAGRFAVTLNAVISSERPSLAPPVVFLLRRVLETCVSYDQAVDVLAGSPIAADCLLLVSGTKAGEMVVIERTSTRSAVRGPERGFLAVTNDYRQLDATSSATVSRLQETACGRFERVTELLARRLPANANGCLRILQDPAVQMTITMQQMVLRPRTGELVVHASA